MIIPIRCMSCGKPVAHLWNNYKDRTSRGENAKKVMDELGLERYFMSIRGLKTSHKEFYEIVIKNCYSRNF